jgi:polyphosphate kinase
MKSTSKRTPSQNASTSLVPAGTGQRHPAVNSSRSLSAAASAAASSRATSAAKASAQRPPSKIDLTDPSLYINRELSWIEFNRRVLEEAEDTNNPMLERLKFLAIFSSNLDEFFMIRIAGLKEQLDAGVINLVLDETPVYQQLAAIRARLAPLIQKQAMLLRDLLPDLAKAGIVIHPYSKLNSRDKAHVEQYFYQTVFPLLTPLAIDSGHPFPQVLNRSLNILFAVGGPEQEAERRSVVLQLPQVLSRFVRLERKTGYHYVLMEEVIQAHSGALFPGLTVMESYSFRVSRDADIAIAEDEASDLLTEMEEQVRKRLWGAAVRLEIDERTPEHWRELLMTLLDLGHDDVYAVSGPRNIMDFMELTGLDVRQLRYPSFSSRITPRFGVESSNPAALFATIRQQDLLVHHPFDSFSNHVVKFALAAADDPAVLAMKVTLYRAGRKSPVVESLIKAAQNGKQVTAFVELKARFDEENNIIWARELERAGVHVVYGIMGLKTHAKIMMVIRKDDDRIRTYVHLSTGNYNQATARFYTDIGYFTARDEFGLDAINLFNFLTGYSQCRDWKQFAVAPLTLQPKLLELIRREMDVHSPESPGEIVVKLNALVDEKIISALYRASQKGVRIRLLVRGMCCLRPGVPGVSETIEVRSIVGRFLEHSRIMYFKNGGEEEIYLSSADWMPRNLYRRVEILFPVPEAVAKMQIKHLLNVYWNDTEKTRVLHTDGRYERLQPADGAEPFSSQQYFLDELRMHSKSLSGDEKNMEEIEKMLASSTLFLSAPASAQGVLPKSNNGNITDSSDNVADF